MNPIPVVLYGERIRLEPLDHRHATALYEAAQNDELWRFLPLPRPAVPDEMMALIDHAWQSASLGQELPFAVVDQGTDRALGSVRLVDIRRSDRVVGIGWDWLSVGEQDQVVQTEMMYLLLLYAFEDLGAVRVVLKADTRDPRRLSLFETMGAVSEGVLRRDVVGWDGKSCDIAIFSILGYEWTVVKNRLAAMAAVAD